MNETRLDPGRLADVAVRSADDCWTLIFSRDLRHPPTKVWAALTDPDQLARWAPFLASRDLTAIGGATLTMVDGNERRDLAASVTSSEPPTLLEYTWGSDVLRWELAAIQIDIDSTVAENSTGTRLTLRHTVGSRDFIPKAAAGWHLCLLVAERLLDGRPIEPIRGMEALNHGWAELNDSYSARLGIPATGPPEDSTRQ